MILKGFSHGNPIDFEALFIGHDLQGRPGYLNREAGNAFLRMRADARAAGVSLDFTTAFRTMEHQQLLFDEMNAAKAHGKPHSIVAKPGYSNHQSGRDIDIATKGRGRENVLPWLRVNAAKYGLVRPVQSENWHYEYSPEKALS